MHPQDDRYLLQLFSPGILEQHPHHPEGRRQHRLHLQQKGPTYSSKGRVELLSGPESQWRHGTHPGLYKNSSPEGGHHQNLQQMILQVLK